MADPTQLSDLMDRHPADTKASYRIVHVSVAGVAPDTKIGEAEAETMVVALVDAVEEHVLVDVSAAVDLEALAEMN